ncbi:MAG: DUF2273 domain-containing protein [Candidatus Bipolaricaulia bacterium]
MNRINVTPRFLGVAFGVVIGVLFIVLGFWKTVLIALLAILGYYIGKYWESETEMRERLKKLLSFFR